MKVVVIDEVRQTEYNADLLEVHYRVKKIEKNMTNVVDNVLQLKSLLFNDIKAYNQRRQHIKTLQKAIFCSDSVEVLKLLQIESNVTIRKEKLHFSIISNLII